MALLERVAASVKLTRRGRDHWGSCPFHAEKSASFKVGEYRGKQRFICFGCGARGDETDWIMRTQRVDFKEARRLLGEPFRPDPAIAELRRQEAWRARELSTYRDRRPECECPDWLLATSPAPPSYRAPIRRESRKFTEEEFDRIYAASIWAIDL